MEERVRRLEERVGRIQADVADANGAIRSDFRKELCEQRSELHKELRELRNDFRTELRAMLMGAGMVGAWVIVMTAFVVGCTRLS